MKTPPVVDRPLFFLDYDGTLAPIVAEPMEAYPHEDVPALLERLEARYPVYLVTGRHLRDLKTLMPTPALQAIGLHGTQRGRVGGEIEHHIAPEAEQAMAELRAALPEMNGLEVEDKGPSFAVHYRRAADEQDVQQRLREWAAQVPEEVLEMIWGKKVVEVRPTGTSKGVAVREVAAEHPDRTPLYLGDDVTDEDAFETLDEDGVTIKVGEGETRARYRLEDVEAVVRYLKRYLE